MRLASRKSNRWLGHKLGILEFEPKRMHFEAGSFTEPELNHRKGLLSITAKSLSCTTLVALP